MMSFPHARGQSRGRREEGTPSHQKLRYALSCRARVQFERISVSQMRCVFSFCSARAFSACLSASCFFFSAFLASRIMVLNAERCLRSSALDFGGKCGMRVRLADGVADVDVVSVLDRSAFPADASWSLVGFTLASLLP